MAKIETMRGVILILSILTYSICFAQFSIKAEKHSIGPITYEFPVLCGPDSLVVGKVNTYLQDRLLDHKYLGKGENIFAEQENDNEFDGYPRVNDLSYEVQLLNSTLLSLSVTADFCGAYCEWATMRFVFNLKSGERLELSQVFKTSKHQVLLATFNEDRFNQIERCLIQLHLERENNPDIDMERLEETHWLYNECLNDEDHYLNRYRFQIIKDRLQIYRERCSSHVLRAFDEVGEFHWDFDFEKLKVFMTPKFLQLL
jgi:hypothetical protein